MRILMTAVLALALGSPLSAAAKPEPAGVITTVSGKVTLFSAPLAKDAAPSAKSIAAGQPVYAGDRIKTGANGRVALVLADGTQLKVNYSSDITLKGKDSKGRSSSRGIAAIGILVGDLWAKVTKKDSTLEFDTPAAVAAVKGTEPIIGVTPDGTTCVQLRNGEVLLTNEQDGSATLDPNQQICIAKGQAISKSMVQPWTAKAVQTWDQAFTQATNASVVVTYKNAAGAEKTFTLNYAPGAASPTAQGATTPAAGK
jgi:hypothetical protein